VFSEYSELMELFFCLQMASLYNKDSLVTAVLDKIDLVILPVVNVDGYEYTWTVSKGLGHQGNN
jgi:murein tripeptide amidase MpaA